MGPHLPPPDSLLNIVPFQPDHFAGIVGAFPTIQIKFRLTPGINAAIRAGVFDLIFLFLFWAGNPAKAHPIDFKAVVNSWSAAVSKRSPGMI